MRYTIGIDVGQYGAAMLVSPDGTFTNGGNFTDWKDWGHWLKTAKEDMKMKGAGLLVGLEHTKAIPGKGGNGLIEFGANFGGWKALLEYLEIPYILVPPNKWQKKMLGSFPSGEAKIRASSYIKRRFPSLELTKNAKKNEGIIDALCIALYVRENH